MITFDTNCFSPSSLLLYLSKNVISDPTFFQIFSRFIRLRFQSLIRPTLLGGANLEKYFIIRSGYTRAASIRYRVAHK